MSSPPLRYPGLSTVRGPRRPPGLPASLAPPLPDAVSYGGPARVGHPRKPSLGKKRQAHYHSIDRLFQSSQKSRTTYHPECLLTLQLPAPHSELLRLVQESGFLTDSAGSFQTSALKLTNHRARGIWPSRRPAELPPALCGVGCVPDDLLCWSLKEKL